MNAATLSAGGAVPPNRLGAQARLRALQAEIIDLILERELEPGEALPTETELAALLGIGRNTLREALKVLQALGVIEIRHGFGMFVAPSSFGALTDGLTFRARLSLRHHGHEALELIELRRVLESALIGGSMALMTPDRLAGLEATVRRMEALADPESTSRSRRRIPPPAVRAAGQRAAARPARAFQAVYRGIQQELGGDDVDPTAAAALHRSIYEAVAAGGAALAAERLGRHFDGLRRRIAGSRGSRGVAGGPRWSQTAALFRRRRTRKTKDPHRRTGADLFSVSLSLCAQRDSNP